MPNSIKIVRTGIPSALAVLLFATQGTLPAQIGPVRAKAWVAVNADGSMVSSALNFNSSGNSNTVTRIGTGTYAVVYPGLGLATATFQGAGGMVHVTSRSATARCKPASYDVVGANVQSQISCRDYTGSLVDSGFNALYYRESRETNEGFDGYLFGTLPTTASYTADPRYSWNSKGGTNSVTRQATGVYTAIFPGLGGTPTAHAQVTATGTDNAYCNLQVFFGSPDVQVAVNCFSATGTAADAQFLVSYMTDVAVGVKETAYQALGAYAYTDQPSAASYTPASTLSLNTSGGSLTASRSATGTYSMNFGNLWSDAPYIALVTALGFGNSNYCSAGSVSADGNFGTNVGVTCKNSAGVLTDTNYEILMLTSVPQRAKAWVYVNANGTQSSTYNSSGLPNLTSRSSTGFYTVIHQGLAAPQHNGYGGIVEVASATPGIRCKSELYGVNGGDLGQYVRCRDLAGANADAAFSALFYIESRQTTDWGDAYLDADQPSLPGPYTPFPAFSWNSKRGANSVTRTSAGTYRVTLGGLGSPPNGGHVQVTAYGVDDRYCTAGGWGASGADMQVTVNCYAPAGTAADAEFLLSFMSDASPAVNVNTDATPGAYVWADNATAVSYTPNTFYSLNSTGGAIVGSRTGTGAYAMNFGNLPVSKSSIALVTAYSGNASCNTAPPAAGANSGVSIGVNCVTPVGAAADTRYDLLYLTSPAASKLGMTVSHNGTFFQNETGVTYTIVVSNAAGAAVGNTSGTVTVTEAPPAGLTITSMAGIGWTCNTSTCTRSDALVPGGDYPAITVTGNLATVPTVVNAVTISGGNSLTAGQIIDVAQAQLGCSVSVPVTTGTIGVGGGASSFNVTASGCIWNVTSNASWITVTSGSQGINNGTVAFTITANPNPTPRSGTITVFGEAFTLTQSGSTIVGNSPALRFVPVTPCRIADTRNANGALGGPSLAAAESRDFNIPAGPCGVPASAVAYSLNLTVVPVGALGFLSAWPAGQSQPVVSTLNSLDGRIKANSAIVPAGLNGAITLFASHPTHAIVDINGYFVLSSGPSNMAFYPITPCRLADTRSANGTLGGPALAGGVQRTFPVSGFCGIPASAQAYAFNMTVVPTGPLGFLSVWPAGGPQPSSSTLNATTGAITSNLAIVPAGTNGSITAITTSDTHLIIDVNGYFAPPGQGSLDFYTVTPCRIADTRDPTGPFGGPSLSPSVARTFAVPSSTCGVPATAQAYSLNATVVPPSTLGFLTLWGSGTQPGISTLNALDGTIVANATLVPAGTNGVVTAIATHVTQLILDINGYFQ